jgi:hypothetical protein
VKFCRAVRRVAHAVAQLLGRFVAHAICSAAAVRALALAAVIALWSVTAAAQTGPARVRLPTGSILFGIVTELVPGDYVIILLPHGELRTIPWAALDMVHVRGSYPIGPGAPAPDLRSYEVRTAPASIGPVDDAPARPPTSDTEWAIGARGPVMTPTSGRSPMALGLGGEANLVHWFAPELALYGLFEHVRFSPSHAGSAEARTLMLGAGMRIAGAATGTSALFDVATGYRVLSTANDSRSWYRRGAIPLRLGAGLRFRTGGAGDVDLLLHIAPHLTPYANEAPCYNTCGPRTPAPLGFIGLSLGMNLHV